jgi:hypothetical protein
MPSPKHRQRALIGLFRSRAALEADLAPRRVPRFPWAHDWVSPPTLDVFQTLLGASFIVNGAAPAKNSAFTSAGAELRLSKRRFALRQVRCRRAQAPGRNGKRARSMSGLMSGSTLYDTVLLLSIVGAIVVGAWLLWRI